MNLFWDGGGFPKIILLLNLLPRFEGFPYDIENYRTFEALRCRWPARCCSLEGNRKGKSLEIWTIQTRKNSTHWAFLVVWESNFYLVVGKVSTFSLLSRASFKAGIWILLDTSFGGGFLLTRMSDVLHDIFPPKRAKTTQPPLNGKFSPLEVVMIWDKIGWEMSWKTGLVSDVKKIRDEGNSSPTSSWHLPFFTPAIIPNHHAWVVLWFPGFLQHHVLGQNFCPPLEKNDALFHRILSHCHWKPTL